MGAVEWIKLDVDMFDNRKIKHIRKLPEGNNIVLIWVMLLTLAGRCNAGGLIFLTENIPYSAKMLADELDFEENTVKLAIEALEKFGMISTDGFLSITGWEEHQNAMALNSIREYNRIAKQKSREKQKQKQIESGVNDMSLTSQINFNEKSENSSYSISNSKDKDSNRGMGEEEGKKKVKQKYDEFVEFAGDDKELLEALCDFEKMRIQKKKPMGDRAKKILVNKLEKFDRSQWIAILEQSILNGWDSVWSLKDDGGNANGFGSNQSGRYGNNAGENQVNSKFSGFKPSLDPDDESTW